MSAISGRCTFTTTFVPSSEFREELFDLLPRLLFDHGARHFSVQRLYVLAQLFQLLAVALRKHVDAAGHDLSDLDIGRAQVLKRRAQLLRRETARIEIVLGEDAEHLGRAPFLAVLHLGDVLGDQLLQVIAHFLGALPELSLFFVNRAPSLLGSFPSLVGEHLHARL